MIPIKPPKIAFMAATVPAVFIRREFPDKGKAKSISGASFCHVDKIMAFTQEMDVITEGNQK